MEMDDTLQSMARPAVFDLKPYVAGKPAEEVERELGITNVIKLASNETPLGPSPKAVVAMREAVAKAHVYPDSNCFYLKQDLAVHTGFGPDNILVGNGSDDLLKLIAETFVLPGDEVIMADPSFGEYEFVTRIMAGTCVMLPLRDFRHDLPAMLARVSERTKILFVCNPNNPTGSIVERSEVEELMRRIPDHVLVIFDEAYVEYATSPDFPDSLRFVREGRKAIVLRTFSKIYGLAGLRVGYGITTPEIAALVSRVKEPFNVNAIAQAGARAALTDQEHVHKSRQVNTEGLAYLYSEFAGMGLRYVPSQANFVFVDVGHDSRAVFQKLLHKGVIIRTGDIFGTPTFIRVTVGTRAENERFIAALKTVLEEVKG
jgi:histidinol-phosphate aminotransferase